MKPLGHLLEDEVVDPERLAKTWKGTRSALYSRDLRDARRYGALAMACALACVFVWWQGEGTRALELASGGSPQHVVAEMPTTLRFDDGSAIHMETRAELTPTQNVAGLFELEQQAGTLDYEVTPGGPRRWVVDAGLARIEVVGTAFRVERTDDSVRVSVARGRVRMAWRTSEGEETVVLGAGEEQWVRAVRTRVATVVTPPSPESRSQEPDLVEEAANGGTDAPPPRGVETVAAWRELATRGAHEAAYRALRDDARPDGTLSQRAHASRDPEELMLLADTARLSGHASEAIEPLERLSRDYPSDPRAPLAAIVLGRVQMQRGDRDAALEAFARAESLGIPAALRDDVARRVASLRSP